MKFIKDNKKITPLKTLALSFLIIILIGTLLLLMPFSSNHNVSLIDALFTSTSATCVTGLVVFDTSAHWTLAGQIIILILIQLGGLGIMTFSTLGAYIIAGKLNMRNRQLIEGSFGGKQIPNAGVLLYAIVVGTLVIESIGAFFLTLRFLAFYPVHKAIYMGIFHSISAFCNAGFALYPNSLENYCSDGIINFTIMFLIIVGGIGFWVIFDTMQLIKKKRHRIGLHSRIVYFSTALLIITGTALILFFEWNNTLKDFTFSNKLVTAAFQSVTSRTAGFNTIEINAMTSSSLLLIVLLMFIGASPGSCGGGIKTSTFAVILAMVFSRIRDERQVRMFKRGVPEQIVSRSIGIAFFALIFVFFAILILLITEHPGWPFFEERELFLKVVFEAVSALGTVGLSMGITPILSVTGKIVIIILMYVGRIGPLSIALAIAGRKPLRMRYAEEEFWVG